MTNEEISVLLSRSNYAICRSIANDVTEHVVPTKTLNFCVNISGIFQRIFRCPAAVFRSE